MLHFAAERLVRMVVVVWAMSLITFALFWAIPSYDAAYTLAGGPTGANTPEVRAQIRNELGLDKPLPVQYVRLMGDVATLRVTNWARATVDRHKSAVSCSTGCPSPPPWWAGRRSWRPSGVPRWPSWR